MLTLRDSVYGELEKAADQRGVSIQGLIRAVIVPEWQKYRSHADWEKAEWSLPGAERTEDLGGFSPDAVATREQQNR